MKQTYSAPLVSIEQIRMEHNFLGSEWLTQGGQGNFNYDVEEDDEFAI